MKNVDPGINPIKKTLGNNYIIDHQAFEKYLFEDKWVALKYWEDYCKGISKFVNKED